MSAAATQSHSVTAAGSHISSHHQTPTASSPSRSRDDLDSAQLLQLLNSGTSSATSDASIPAQSTGAEHASHGAPTTFSNSLSISSIIHGPVAPPQHSPTSSIGSHATSGREVAPLITGATSNELSSASPQASLAVPAPSGQICSNCGTTRTPLWRRSPLGETICNACGLYQKARNQARPTNLKRASHSGFVAQIGSQEAQADGNSPAFASAECTPSGTCPGDGRCNGTGGRAGCDGCPAFNNRIAKSQQAVQSTQNGTTVSSIPAQMAASGLAQAGSAMPACQNCGTTVTPLWRRDDDGHTICNACGGDCSI